MSALSTSAPQARSSAPAPSSRGADVAGPQLSDPLQDPLQLSALHSDGIMEAAGEGLSGGGGSLPFLDQIQASFGRHDVSGVQAHTGARASAAADAMGARAYASGGQVAFGGAPDLHTAAHEAAHVVQQQGGVQLKGGVGQAGDRYERHADAVADAVVQGKSAEGLLDPYAGSGGGGGGAVQQVQMVVDVFSAAHFANPTAYLTTAGAGGPGGAGAANKVVEEPGAQGILGVPDMKLINVLGTEATREGMQDRIERLSRAIARTLREAEEADQVAQAGADADAKAASSKTLTAARQKQGLITEVKSDLYNIYDLPSAGDWYRRHTLALSKLGSSPTETHNAGNAAAAGHKSWTFHKDAGLLSVTEANLQGSAADKRRKAASLNGPFGTGFVRGHGSIGNMKHRFIEHIHVNKGAADAIDIYNGTADMGRQAEEAGPATLAEDAGLHGTDKAERDAQLTNANAADIAELTRRQGVIDAAAAAAPAPAAPAPAAPAPAAPAPAAPAPAAPAPAAPAPAAAPPRADENGV